jgi:hypothetical protein
LAAQTPKTEGMVDVRATGTLLAALFIASCATSGRRGALDTVPGSSDAKLEPPLMARVRSSPLSYFRFKNVAFSNEVCRLLRAKHEEIPLVNLHGDAHLEQYAVTDTGRGLTDFDDATTGPAVLDLVRFGTSLVLASRERGWNDAADRSLGEFLRGYRSALEDPGVTAPEPRIVGRIRSALRFEPQRYFAWVMSVMDSVPVETATAIGSSLQPYVRAMLAQDTSLSPDYFRIQKLGGSHMGIGSSRATKYVVRVRGSTDSPDDDDVLELKEIGDRAGIACISPSTVPPPEQLITVQARIAYQPYRLVGYVVLDGKYFWVHAWARLYRELSVGDVESADELAELAFDVGVQLGLGHPKGLGPPLDPALRQSDLRFMSEHEGRLKTVSTNMADEVIAAWERFRKATEVPTDTSK